MTPIDIIMTVLVTAILFLVPGLVVCSRQAGHHEKVSVEMICIWVMASLLITGLIGLLLAVLGVYSLPTLVMLVMLLTIVFVVAFGFKPPVRFSRPSPLDTFGLLVIFFVATALFSNPAEIFSGFGDSFMHFNEAGVISNWGSTVYMDEIMVLLGPNLSQTLVAPVHTALVDMSTGETDIAMFHQYAVFLAIFNDLFGYQGMLWASSVFGVLAMVITFLVFRRVIGTGPAILAVTILCTSYVQIWCVNVHESETLFQLLFMGLLLILMVHEETGGPELVTLAIWCIVAMMVCRIEATFLLIALIVALLMYALCLGPDDRAKVAHVFREDMGKGPLLSIAVAVPGVLLYYSTAGSVNLRLYNDIVLALTGILLISAMVAMTILWQAGSGRRLPRMGRNHMVGLILIVLACFLCSIPLGLNYTPAYTSQYLLKILVSYIGAVVFLGCMLGVLWLIVAKGAKFPELLLLITGLIFFMYFIYTARHQPGQPWMMRRYFSVTYPFLFLGLGAAIGWVWRLSGRIKGARKAVAIKMTAAALATSCLLITISIASPVIGYTDMDGFHDQVIETFDDYDNSMLIFGYGSFPRIWQPLKLIKGFHVMMLPAGAGNSVNFPKNASEIEAFMEALPLLQEAYGEVFIVNPSAHFIKEMSPHIDIVLVKEASINSTSIRYTVGTFPTEHVNIKIGIKIYRLAPHGGWL